MMLQHFRQLQQWQDNLSRFMAAKQKENAERNETNAKVSAETTKAIQMCFIIDTKTEKLNSFPFELPQLQLEVLQLHKELTAMTEQMDAERAAHQAEKIELVQKVSHQNAMLMNMSGQIAQLEGSLHTFEVVGGVRSAAPASTAATSSAEQTRTIELLTQTVSELRTELGNMQRSVPLDTSLRCQLADNEAAMRQLRAEVLDYQQKLVSANNSVSDAPKRRLGFLHPISNVEPYVCNFSTRTRCATCTSCATNARSSSIR